MSSHWYMLDASNATVEITSYVDIDDGPTATVNAEQGSVATWQLTLSDPDGTLEVTGHKPIWWTEDEADFERIATGFIADRTYYRDENKTGAGRDIVLTISDINALIWRKVMAGNDTDRPAEDDTDRMDWLLSTGEAGNLGDVTTYVETTAGVAMDANPDTGYNGQMMQAIFDDCAQTSGRNYFMLDADDTTGVNPAVWYGQDSSALFTTDTRISNYIADVDNETVFYALLDTELKRDPSRVFGGIFLNYDGGYTYQSDAGIISAYANRDTIASYPNVKTHAKAVARALRQLASLDTEDDVISTGYYSNGMHVNDIRAGMRMWARFSHYATEGYADWREFRVLNRTVSEVAPGWDDEVRYLINLDLNPLPPPVSCEDIVGLTVTEDGPVEWDDVPGFFTNLTTTPPTPSGTGINLVGWAGATGFTGSGDWNLDSGPYTLLAEIPAALSPIQGLAAYEAVSSSASLLSVSGPRVDGYTFLSCFIPTAETAPVQIGNQMGTGGTVTFPGTPTPGNIIVAFMIDSENQSQPPRDLTPYGWTLLYMSDGDTGFGWHTGGIQSISAALWARCVQEGDTATYPVDSESFTHWTFCSEWALT